MSARLAGPADRDPVLQLVSRLLAELGGTPPSLADMAPFYDELTSGGNAGYIVVGEDAGIATAVCTVSFVTALRSRGRYGIIQEIFVVPEARSRGIGMSVLRFALEYADDMGCSLVELGTPADGNRQIEFYQRAGFVRVGARLRWRP